MMVLGKNTFNSVNLLALHCSLCHDTEAMFPEGSGGQGGNPLAERLAGPMRDGYCLNASFNYFTFAVDVG